jgi:hypothetical protein
MLDMGILQLNPRVFGGVILIVLVYILYLHVYHNEQFEKLKTRYGKYVKIAITLTIAFISIYCMKKVMKEEVLSDSPPLFLPVSPVPSISQSIPSPTPSVSQSVRSASVSPSVPVSQYVGSDVSSLMGSVKSP